jgi:hypothetical protein
LSELPRLAYGIVTVRGVNPLLITR